MLDHVVHMPLNPQQLALFHRSMEAAGVDGLSALASLALRERDRPPERPAAPPAPDLAGLSTARALRSEIVLEPGTGKAIELRAGEVMRIEQIEGGQCVDFNCFNLHDHKEFFHTGRTRTLHGINPGPGDFLWSAPPRERALMLILEDTVRCNDVLFPRCSANLYESVYGFGTHTNCHDIQAEAQREYGLTPDDVHDSFNLFMCTEVVGGRGRISRQTSKPGDHVDLLALIDLLAVPNVCGSDLMKTSNFFLKPVKVQVLSASARDKASVPALPNHASQRTPAAFRQPNIKADRPLRRDPDYVPQFDNVPLLASTHRIALDAADHARLRGAGLEAFYGDDEGAALRDVIFSWWEARNL